ncbi:ferredoxin [Paeniglutamicibacter sp.]|uniref:ferredoxin n=1 Tax=Paeniglutamicibacter sp. TaxID=1934391 RepID=UPI003989DFE9
MNQSTDMLRETMHQVSLDTARCRAYGICVGMAPDVFDLPKGNPAAILRRQVIGEEDFDDVEEAVLSCPAQALKLSRIENGS